MTKVRTTDLKVEQQGSGGQETFTQWLIWIIYEERTGSWTVIPAKNKKRKTKK